MMKYKIEMEKTMHIGKTILDLSKTSIYELYYILIFIPKRDEQNLQNFYKDFENYGNYVNNKSIITECANLTVIGHNVFLVKIIKLQCILVITMKYKMIK